MIRHSLNQFKGIAASSIVSFQGRAQKLAMFAMMGGMLAWALPKYQNDFPSHRSCELANRQTFQGKSPLCVKFPHPTTTLRKLKPFCQKPGCDVVDTLPWNLAFCAKQNFGQINFGGKLVGRTARARDDCQ
jgi:hypothetical protein